MFRENLVHIHEVKAVLLFNKQIYVGFSILELSKYLMYEFNCKYIKRKNNAKFLFTDPDSLVYEIETEDVYEGFYRYTNLIDFSGYSQDSKFFDPANKSFISKIKGEFKRKKLVNLFD